MHLPTPRTTFLSALTTPEMAPVVSESEKQQKIEGRALRHLLKGGKDEDGRDDSVEHLHPREKDGRKALQEQDDGAGPEPSAHAEALAHQIDHDAAEGVGFMRQNSPAISPAFLLSMENSS
jgi:hypothetical protein